MKKKKFQLPQNDNSRKTKQNQTKFATILSDDTTQAKPKHKSIVLQKEIRNNYYFYLCVCVCVYAENAYC